MWFIVRLQRIYDRKLIFMGRVIIPQTVAEIIPIVSILLVTLFSLLLKFNDRSSLYFIYVMES